MQVLQVQLAVQADPSEVGRARRWVRARLAGQGLDPDAPVAETLVLVVSELVTNAVVHTGCPAVLRLSMPVPGGLRAAGHGSAGGFAGGPDGGFAGGADGGFGGGPDGGFAGGPARSVPVRVEVADASLVAPAPRHAGGEATNGRGLELVELLCDRWGWYPDGSGKRVWCEIDPDARGHADCPTDPAATAALAL
ncbi:ATP-binding protein [Kitasatospora sp. NPDC088346]|uniref:ATP-binding protein n=1 Tax=Kitasatospora sp. NPDC088346 TaxID=3364073 RepID=UPI003823D757